MTRNFATVLAIAAVLIAIPMRGHAQQSGPTSDGAGSAMTTGDPVQEAAKMVSSSAVFTSTLDSDKLHPGSEVQAKLLKKTRLEDGQELPSGTLLNGKVVTDDTQKGMAKIALQFTAANLKGGKTVPIKATIVNVYDLPSPTEPGQEELDKPLMWNHKTVAIDQVGAVSGVDLHSRIAGPDSGVFVSTKKNNIKISQRIGIELAIAPEGEATQQKMGGS